MKEGLDAAGMFACDEISKKAVSDGVVDPELRVSNHHRNANEESPEMSLLVPKLYATDNVTIIPADWKGQIGRTWESTIPT